MVPQLLPHPGLAMPGWGTTTGEVRDLWAAGRQGGCPTLHRGKRRPCLVPVQQLGHSSGLNVFYLKMTLHGTHNNMAFNFRCFASNGTGFGADSTNKKKIKGKRKQKDTGLEPSKQVMDKQFMEKLEAVRRSALEKKKTEENINYLAIDYDAPIESDKKTIDFGTRVGIGVAVVVFGLVFAFGDFLPSGSVSPSKESTVVKQNLSKEEEAKFKSALEGFEATLSKSPNDPTALEGAAVSLVELGEYEKASTYLENLVKVIPDKAEAYRLLGEVKFELKDYDGSSSSYKNALSSSDNIDFDVLRGLTNSLLAAKKPDQAVDVILSCRRKLNENSQIQRADPANDSGAQKPQDIDPIQVDLLLGKAYSDWGRISDAVSVYDELINEHPEDFRPYLAKGIILKENGKTGEAERMFIQAKFFAPEAAKALVDRYAQR
ncbi:hypothetical protein QOZ80_7AG0561320 [Eleusine coracana subsp. coracana]|nr:hypothetical protein QOZ80_7AG0561320 [Eleusine coracana subsp. coracana]